MPAATEQHSAPGAGSDVLIENVLSWRPGELVPFFYLLGSVSHLQ